MKTPSSLTANSRRKSSGLRAAFAIAAAFSLMLAGGLHADTSVIYFNNGTITDTPAGVTLNQFTTSAFTLQDTVGVSTGISIASSGFGNWAGSGGTFKNTANGSVTYNNSNGLVNNWISTYQADYGDIWQQAANPAASSGGAASLTLSGLTADTTYTLTLLSTRANTYAGASGTATGNYALSYNGSTLTPTEVAGSAPSDTITSGTVNGLSLGDASGDNTREIDWTFTTDSNPQNAVLNLSGLWNVNAVMLIAVPEPSTIALTVIFGAGMLLLFRRRRTA